MPRMARRAMPQMQSPVLSGNRAPIDPPKSQEDQKFDNTATAVKKVAEQIVVTKRINGTGCKSICLARPCRRRPLKRARGILVPMRRGGKLAYAKPRLLPTVCGRLAYRTAKNLHARGAIKVVEELNYSAAASGPRGQSHPGQAGRKPNSH